MNIALTHRHAAEKIRVGGRHGLVRAFVLACALACASGAVLAGPERERDGQNNSQQQQAQTDRHEAPRAERMAPPQAQARQFDGRTAEPRADEQRRQAQQQAPQQDQSASRHVGRLTPDERRELRRQINEAGTDLYPNTPRR